MIEFRLLAFDSLGVRSMATVVETSSVKVMIDPSVALAPKRYGLPPHPKEFELMREMASLIYEEAMDSDVIVITHYHYDHFDLGDKVPLEVYEGKLVLIKDPVNKINASQRYKRAPRFLKAIEGLPKEIKVADGNSFKLSSTTISFSEAVPHGLNDRLGYVVQVLIEEGGERFLFSSDVEGPALREQVEFMLRSSPNWAVVDGPMTYMLGYRYSKDALESSIRNLLSLLDQPQLELLVLDHHLCRELEFRDRLKLLGNKFKTAAQASGRPENLLEAKRKELYRS